MTRADLAESLHKEIGLSRADSAKIVEQVLKHMCEALAHGENVKISGFGTFVLRDKGERVGRNPKTGVEVPILPRCVLVFRPSQVMKARINGENPPPDEPDDVEHEDTGDDSVAEDETAVARGAEGRTG